MWCAKAKSKLANNSGKSLRVLLTLLLFVLFWFSLAAMPALAVPLYSCEITGTGVERPLSLTLAELEELEQYEHVYSAINTYPTKQWYTARGVKLRELLALAGLKEEATLIRFYSRDGYDVTFTVKELLADKRYYFPGLKENHPSDGSVPGSPDGAEVVESILALVSAEGSNSPDHMNAKDSPQLVFGQRAVTEQISTLFVKNVNKIEVLTSEPEKWDKPRISIPDGSTLPPGTELILENKNSDVDKIYYTTDGSTPTVNSPMFNWSASRWWPLRGDLDKVNSPIKITEDMVVGENVVVIKAKTIGPGKEDSDVVTFTFTLDPEAVDPSLEPGGPPTGVFLDRTEITLPIGSAFQLEAIVEPFNAVNKKVIWRSSNNSVATVDTRGLVTVVGQGTAIITVETVEGNYTATCVINSSSGEKEEQIREERPTIDVKPEEEHPQEQKTAEPANTNDTENPGPKGRQERLAKVEELPVNAVEGMDGQAENPASRVQVFEVSVFGPSPLIQKENLDLYAWLIILFLLLSGAGKKYMEYVKE
ncbi:MAG: Ig-like domain-containing protein [bacterium]